MAASVLDNRLGPMQGPRSSAFSSTATTSSSRATISDQMSSTPVAFSAGEVSTALSFQVPQAQLPPSLLHDVAQPWLLSPPPPLPPPLLRLPENLEARPDLAGDAAALAAAGTAMLGMPGRSESSKTGWLSTVPLILATTVGNGALVLPGAFATLGWAAGVASLLLCYGASLFTAQLLHTLHLKYRYALAGSIGDLVAYHFGMTGGYATWGVLYLALFQFLCNFLLDLARIVEMYAASSTGSSCGSLIQLQPHVKAKLLAGLCLVPVLQIRRLHHLAWLAILSVMAITAVLLMYLVMIFVDGDVGSQGVPYDRSSSVSDVAMAAAGLSLATSSRFPPLDRLIPERQCVKEVLPTTVTTGALVVAVSHIALAHSGQVIFLEIQAEMREPASFSKSLRVVYTLLFLLYGISCTATFARCGEHTPVHIFEVLSRNRYVFPVSTALVFLNHVASFAIFQQVLAREVAVWFVPGALREGWRARALWLLITLVQMVLVLLTVNFVPHFCSLCSFAGMLVSTQAFSFPCVLGVAACCRHQLLARRSLDVAASLVCFAIIVATLGLTVGGITWGFQDICEVVQE